MQHDEFDGKPVAAADNDGSGEWTERFVILGRTADGRTFRPSDWAERLAGVMAAFRPGRAGVQQHLVYSPYVVPATQRGDRCVIVDPQLRALEPMAYSFLLNFARDNDLVTEALASAGAPLPRTAHGPAASAPHLSGPAQAAAPRSAGEPPPGQGWREASLPVT